MARHAARHPPNHKRGSGTAGLALSGRDARGVLTDSRGDMWVATSSGVFKFDGSDFVLFDQARGLASNDARALAEDKSGKIWVATSSGFATIDGQTAAPLEQPNRAIDLTDAQSVFVDWGGTIWLATAKGAFFFDGARVNILVADRDGSREFSRSGRAFQRSRDKPGP